MEHIKLEDFFIDRRGRKGNREELPHPPETLVSYPFIKYPIEELDRLAEEVRRKGSQASPEARAYREWLASITPLDDDNPH